MVAALVSLMILGLSLGVLLGVAARVFKVEGNPLEAEIEAMLPGSQCGQCGFPGCSPAAAAVANGKAPVTLCPPGGRNLAQALANKLGVTVDLSGVEDQMPIYAHIREGLCIGCTKCFKRCPTDAIMGAHEQIHVVFRDACTGCKKCFEVCPTECIEMRPIEPTTQTWYWSKPLEAG
ncbi:MAG: RnfABCDGE type electron transport complex subunit B [Gammaproteobacteria bacterium]|nr:RnfABCDGE type electron transport complex subunit B [Gammaproteobacteria bacterium]